MKYFLATVAILAYNLNTRGTRTHMAPRVAWMPTLLLVQLTRLFTFRYCLAASDGGIDDLITTPAAQWVV